MVEDDSDNEHAQGDVCSFVECSSGNPKTLCPVAMLEDMTASATSHRAWRSHIENYVQ